MSKKLRRRTRPQDHEWSLVKDIARASDHDFEAMKLGKMGCRGYLVLIDRARTYRRKLDKFFNPRVFSKEVDAPRTYDDLTSKERRAFSRNLSVWVHLKGKILKLQMLALARYREC